MKSTENETIISCTKVLLFIVNFMAWLCGITLFGIALWVRLDHSLMAYINIMDMRWYYNATYIAMTCGALMFFVGFLGCFSVTFESRWGLIIYFILLFCMFGMELGASTFVLQNGTEYSNLDPFTEDALYQLLYNYNDDYTRWVFDSLQAQLRCCGVNNFHDYELVNLPIPNSCRDPTTGLQFKDDCVEEFVFYVEYKSGLMAGFMLGMCVLHIFAMIMSMFLCLAFKDDGVYS